MVVPTFIVQNCMYTCGRSGVNNFAFCRTLLTWKRRLMESTVNTVGLYSRTNLKSQQSKLGWACPPEFGLPRPQQFPPRWFRVKDGAGQETKEKVRVLHGSCVLASCRRSKRKKEKNPTETSGSPSSRKMKEIKRKNTKDSLPSICVSCWTNPKPCPHLRRQRWQESRERRPYLLGKELGARAPFSPSDSSSRLLLTHSAAVRFRRALHRNNTQKNWIACSLTAVFHHNNPVHFPTSAKISKNLLYWIIQRFFWFVCLFQSHPSCNPFFFERWCNTRWPPSRECTTDLESCAFHSLVHKQFLFIEMWNIVEEEAGESRRLPRRNAFGWKSRNSLVFLFHQNSKNKKLIFLFSDDFSMAIYRRGIFPTREYNLRLSLSTPCRLSVGIKVK